MCLILIESGRTDEIMPPNSYSFLRNALLTHML